MFIGIGFRCFAAKALRRDVQLIYVENMVKRLLDVASSPIELDQIIKSGIYIKRPDLETRSLSQPPTWSGTTDNQNYECDIRILRQGLGNER